VKKAYTTSYHLILQRPLQVMNLADLTSRVDLPSKKFSEVVQIYVDMTNEMRFIFTDDVFTIRAIGDSVNRNY